jgi:nucleolar protein 14
LYLFQALRQKQREEADDIRHQLDQELNTIRSLLSAPDPVSESLEKKLGSQSVDPAEEDRDQQYDQFVRELVFDQRSKPKDRTETEEELALKAKNALEKAERQRIKRMNGEDDAESGGEESRPAKRRRLIGGDDLEDDFSSSGEWDGLGGGLESNLDNSSERGGVTDDSSDADSDVSEDETDQDRDSEPPWGGHTNASRSKLSDMERNGHQRLKASNELPYTFPCPASHEEFLDAIEGIAEQDVPVVVERIRALHHPSLSADNPSKLKVWMSPMCLSYSFSYIYPTGVSRRPHRPYAPYSITTNPPVIRYLRVASAPSRSHQSIP